MPPEIDVAGEGPTDIAAARVMVLAAGGAEGRSLLPPSARGKQRLLARLPGLVAGSAFGRPLLVLIDLDDSAPCAGPFVAGLPVAASSQCLIRVAVRCLESWLMADRAAYAGYAGLPQRAIPANPDDESKPKHLMLRLVDDGTARRLATVVREARSRGVPDWQSLARWQTNFAESVWNPDRARSRSPSLDRSLSRLKEFVGRLDQ